MDVLKHNLDELLESSTNYLLLQGPIGPFFYRTVSMAKNVSQTSI
ncbi:protein PhyB [Pasteurella multocida]|nr:protein PhyB [Pasteurella multocida]